MSVLKKEYDLLLLKRANNYRFNSNKANLMANKPGKHLSALRKWIQAKPRITLKDKDSNALVRNNKLINNTFKSYYENLYKSEKNNSLDQSSFLDTIKLKQLSYDKKEQLKSETSEDEIVQTIKTFAFKKPPGLDAFQVEFYSTFRRKLAPLFIQMTRYMSHNLVRPRFMYEIIISVTLKPGKSGESPSDFRPRSLISYDNKILTKLISNRLPKALPDLKHINQTGFVKNRHLQTNARTSFSII